MKAKTAGKAGGNIYYARDRWWAKAEGKRKKRSRNRSDLSSLIDASAQLQESAVERLLTLVASAADAAGALEGIVVLGPDNIDVTAASGSKDQALSLNTTGDWVLLRIPRQAVPEEMRGIHFVELER